MTARMAKFLLLAVVAAAMIPATAFADESPAAKAQASHAVAPKANTGGKKSATTPNMTGRHHPKHAAQGNTGKKGVSDAGESTQVGKTFHPIEITGGKKKVKGAKDDWQSSP